MKKLMIAACAMALAVAANAASINWSSGTVQGWSTADYNGWTTGNKEVIGQTGWNDGTFLFKVSIFDSLGNAVAELSGNTAGNADIYRGYTIDKELSSDNMTFKTTEQGGTTYFAQLVVEFTKTGSDSVTTTLTSEKAAFIGYSDTLDPTRIDFVAGTGFVEAGSKIPASGWVAAVPEPTSGLLLLIGMAGLALRRRRA